MPCTEFKKADRRTGNSDPGPRRHFQNKVYFVYLFTRIYLFIYLASCTMFPHLPAPI
jgi:hypothetical protein